MASERSDRVRRLATLASPYMKLLAVKDAWPALVEIEGLSQTYLVALHMGGAVGLSGRGRDRVERRFQNPADKRPVSSLPETLPLLLGLWEPGIGQPLVVGMEVTEERLTRQTRQSYFFPPTLLEEAQARGWADHLSTSGERIIAFHPALLNVYVELRAHDVSLDGGEIGAVVEAAGFGAKAKENQAPRERVKRTVQVLVRSAVFSKRVIEEYEGLCAMCGLDFGLVEGAHILPVRAEESCDAVWNGLALCRNHHGAFDRHLVWIEPSSLSIQLHPELINNSALNEGCSSFVQSTLKTVRLPANVSSRPQKEMFEARYEFFGEDYAWAQKD